MTIGLSSIIVYIVFDMELEAKGMGETVNPLYSPSHALGTEQCSPEGKNDF